MRVPPDARPTSGARAYARSLRSPAQNRWYGDLDPRSWRVALRQARVRHLGTTDLRRGIEVVRAGRRSGRYLCSLPRSGTNWLLTTLSCAAVLHDGGSGTYHLVPDRTPAGHDEWVVDGPRHWWPAVPTSFANALANSRDVEVGHPLWFVSHDPVEQGLIDHRRARPVILVRRPLDAARSLAHMVDLDDALHRPNGLDLAFRRVPRYFGVWEHRLADPGFAARALVLRYEELRDDPLDGLLRIDRHWELGIGAATWEEAARRCSWDEMARRAEDRTDTHRISVRAAELPVEVTDHLEQLCAPLGRGFGYAPT